MADQVKKIIDFRHPSYFSDSTDWEKWRLTYQGGTHFRDRYLERFSQREDTNDFSLRRKITPIPAFAKSAVQEIRNSIFQRMRRGSCPFLRGRWRRREWTRCMSGWRGNGGDQRRPTRSGARWCSWPSTSSTPRPSQRG